MNGQSQANPSTTYVHDKPASFKSKALQVLITVLRKKNQLEKNIKANRFSSGAAEIPKELLRRFRISISEVNQRKVWTFKSNSSDASKTILYIHGGGYVTNLTKYDWNFVHKLLIKTGATIVIPDYPLAPASNYTDVYAFFDRLYSQLLTETPQQNIIFLGNSAGGGIAFGFVQTLRDQNKPQPAQIILQSPWLDITMSNPAIADMDKKDHLLSIKGLKAAGQLYAAGLDAKDYRVSPIYGDLTNLCRIALFVGTNDLFLPDARKLKMMLEEQNISIDYYEYPNMFHVWMAVTSLKESQHAIAQVAALVKQEN